MKQYGFSEELISAQVKQLLHEYGGDDGWPFIEDCGYKVLLEVCLEANTEQENAYEGTLLQDNQTTMQIGGQICNESDKAVSNSEGNSAAAILAQNIPVMSPPHIPSSRPLANSPDTRHLQIVELIRGEEADMSISTLKEEEDKTISNIEGNSPAATLFEKKVNINSSRPLVSLRPKGRPCYGWIDNNEDEEDVDDFIFLTPERRLTSMTASGNPVQMDGATNEKSTRKSRWDLKPEDP